MTIAHNSLDPTPTLKVYVFQCSSETYLGCIEKSVFGSDKSWPLQVRKGDYCLLHHYDADSLFGLWRAESDGGRSLVPKAWGGRFPYQAKVRMASTKIVEVPKELLAQFDVDAAVGRFENPVDERLAESIVAAIQGSK